MVQKFIIQDHHRRLLVLFAGWACDETPFRQYRPSDMDFMVCYDYRDLHFDESVLDAYEEVNVVGWSMGVWAAGEVLNRIRPRKGCTLACNGTCSPISDEIGIPVTVFEETLHQLTPASLQHFMRRICGHSEAYRAFMKITPRRDFAEVKKELQSVYDRYRQNPSFGKESSWQFDWAIYSENDRIFPLKNLRRSDTGAQEIVWKESHHYDAALFQWLLEDRWKTTTQCIDKQRVARCFALSRQTYEKEACVQRQVAEKMMKLLEEGVLQDSSRISPQHIVEVGCGTGSFSRLLLSRLHPQELLLNDLCPEMEECLGDLCCHPEVRFVAEDAEVLQLPADTQLIASCSTVQWFNDLPAFLTRCREALTPDGWLALSTFGPQNLCEIRALTGHGLTYPTLEEWKRWLGHGYEIVHAEEEVVECRFGSPQEVLRHLKQTGVTGTEKRMWTRGILQSFCEGYIRQFGGEDGKVSLTYHPMYLIAKKNHHKENILKNE